METQSVVWRKFKTFISITIIDKMNLFEALYLTAFFKIVIFILPFKTYKRYFGMHNMETSYEIDNSEYKTIRRISWVVSTISKYTPWESKCLVQAMTAQKMLRRRCLYSTLYLGVGKNDEGNNLQAHAWLRSGSIIVTGGQNMEKFNEVAHFSNEAVH